MRKTPRKTMKLLQCTLQWLQDEHTAFSSSLNLRGCEVSSCTRCNRGWKHRVFSLLDIIWTTLLHSTVFFFATPFLNWKVLKLCRTIRQVKKTSPATASLNEMSLCLHTSEQPSLFPSIPPQFRKQTEIFWKTTFRDFQRCCQSYRWCF